jgi:hypothetical protein
MALMKDMQGGNGSRNCRQVKKVILFSTMMVLSSSFHPLLTQPENPPERLSVKQLVELHLSRKQGMQAQDVYKLLYQGSFGVEHLLGDSAAVLEMLLSEISTMDTVNRNEELLERIVTDPEPVRVNLRPFVYLNFDPSLLVKVMYESASETKPDTVMFYRTWNEFVALVRYGILKFPLSDVEMWDAKVQSGIIKAVHHSEAYRQSNRPAYRVVRRSVFLRVFGNVHSTGVQ